MTLRAVHYTKNEGDTPGNMLDLPPAELAQVLAWYDEHTPDGDSARYLSQRRDLERVLRRKAAKVLGKENVKLEHPLYFAVNADEASTKFEGGERYEISPALLELATYHAGDTFDIPRRQKANGGKYSDYADLKALADVLAHEEDMRKAMLPRKGGNYIEGQLWAPYAVEGDMIVPAVKEASGDPDFSGKSRAQVNEDTAYAMANGMELPPSKPRIAAIGELIRRRQDDKVLSKMRRLWRSGHGVLPSKERAEAMFKASSDMTPYEQGFNDHMAKAAHTYSSVKARLLGDRDYGPDYLEGELGEFREAMELGDHHEIKGELQDAMYALQMLAAARMGANDMPIVGADGKIGEFLWRRDQIERMMAERGAQFSLAHLKGGSNVAKPAKIQKAFELAGSPITLEDAEALSARALAEMPADLSSYGVETKQGMAKEAYRLGNLPMRLSEYGKPAGQDDWFA